MSTLRRLSNNDVKIIFDCIYNNEKPSDEKLIFKIIVVGPNGMKLSPPSYEFDDGLYILLKPLKQLKNEKSQYTKALEDDPRIPSNLKSWVYKEKPQLTCPWSLSGPQFPVPTSIQQRYCYPKGEPEYSNVKGGALWTTYDEAGKEDLEYRLLHVYYSAKRAGNKGRTSSSSDVTFPRKKKSKDTIPKLDMPMSSLLEAGSFASASFDSPLSFDMPTSPVDPSIFSNIFVKSLSNDNGDNDNEPIITPDRSVFDVRLAHDRYHNDPRHHAVSRNKSHQQMHPGTIAPNHASNRHITRSAALPMSQHPHYYHPVYPPYWPPVPSNQPCQTCSVDSQDRYMPWGSQTLSNHSKQHPYPLQEERKHSSTVSFF